MKKMINIIINLIFFLLTIIYIYINNPLKDNLISLNNIFLLFFVFCLIHALKCFRQYLLLIESGIHMSDFVKIYIKTTFCSIVLPYKSGEIFKVYEYGYRVNNYMKGLLTVIVDKFFDAILLLLFFIPYEIKKKNGLSELTLILLFFVIALCIIYICFNTTYYYLNKHFIKNGNVKRNVITLKVLEQIYEIYNYVKELIKGRVLLLLILTVLAWALEWLFISILNGGSFIDYINAIFFGNQNYVFSSYVMIGIIWFFIFEIIIVVRKYGVNK